MQRSRITSTPRSGLRSSVRTSSRSSMIFVSTRRDSSSARRSFSSTRTRERSTPTRGLLLNESAPRADEMGADRSTARCEDYYSTSRLLEPTRWEQTAAPRGARTTTQRVGSSSRRDGSRSQHREVRGLLLNESAPRADEMGADRSTARCEDYYSTSRLLEPTRWEQIAAPRGARTTTQRVGSSSRRDGSRSQHREVRGLLLNESAPRADEMGADRSTA